MTDDPSARPLHIVTDAARGLGKAVTERLAADGALLVPVVRSKAGLAILTRPAQLEYGSEGILSFGLVPRLVDTDMQGTIRTSGVNDVSRLQRSALRPAAEPAVAMAWLLSGAGDDLAGGDTEIRDAAFRDRAIEPN